MPRRYCGLWMGLMVLAMLAAGCQAAPPTPRPMTPTLQKQAPSPTPPQPKASPTPMGPTVPAPQGPITPGRPWPIPGSPQPPGMPMPIPLTPPPGQELEMPVRQPIPSVDEAKPRGQKAPFYLSQATLEQAEGKWQVLVDGNLPTPCHRPYFQATRQGERLRLEVFTVRIPDVMCPQVLQPFQGYIDLTPWTQDLKGPLRVQLNDRDLGAVEP